MLNLGSFCEQELFKIRPTCLVLTADALNSLPTELDVKILRFFYDIWCNGAKLRNFLNFRLGQHGDMFVILHVPTQSRRFPLIK